MKLLLVFAALLATAYGTIITAPVSYGNNWGYSGLSNGYVLPSIYGGYGLSRSLYSVPVYNSYSNLGYRNLGYNVGYGRNYGGYYGNYYGLNRGLIW